MTTKSIKRKMPICTLILFVGSFFFLTSIQAQVEYSKNISGKAYNIGYALEWSTVDEGNCKAFIIERSFDGINFKTIASINSKRKENNNYRFNDEELGLKKAFYRLKEVSFDGSSGLTEPIVMDKPFQTNFTVAMVANNSTTGIFEIAVNSIIEEDLVCFVNNEVGDIILKETRTLQYGLNDFVFDLQNEEEGTYNLIFKVGRELETLVINKVDEESKKRNMASHKKQNGGG